jgi:hypothetical protein
MPLAHRHGRPTRALLTSHLTTHALQSRPKMGVRHRPIAHHQHLVPRGSASHRQSHSSPSWVNSVTIAFPSKSATDGETFPSYFFFKLLKGVAHLPDPFTLTTVGSGGSTPPHRPPPPRGHRR